jgi:glycerol-3-phosphate dehydrogenase (NAD(P)+)
VNLWGTWLDDGIVDESLRGAHPKLKLPLPSGVSLFRSGELERALDGAEAVFVAVTSEGFARVFEMALAAMERSVPVLALTKGFVRSGGRVALISSAARSAFGERFPAGRPLWVSIGGPVKAVELARGMPTSTVYASRAGEVEDLAGGFATATYRVFTSDDVTGVELSSSLKNVYSIALGMCDGMYGGRFPNLYHNLRAFVFTQAVREMALIVEKAGGRRETVYGLPGAGDLHVTASSGRNRRFGDLIGAGRTGREAYELMAAEGETAEGYATLEHGADFVKGLGIPVERDLPLFKMLHGVVHGARPLEGEMKAFVEGYSA